MRAASPILLQYSALPGRGFAMPSISQHALFSPMAVSPCDPETRSRLALSNQIGSVTEFGVGSHFSSIPKSPVIRPSSASGHWGSGCFQWSSTITTNRSRPLKYSKWTFYVRDTHHCPWWHQEHYGKWPTPLMDDWIMSLSAAQVLKKAHLLFMLKECISKHEEVKECFGLGPVASHTWPPNKPQT